MPDLLTHVGASYLILRPLIRRREIDLALIGTALPDVAWVARRVLVELDLGFAVVSQGTVPWHTPWAFAAVAVGLGAQLERPARAIAVLLAGGAVHFLLDTAQTRIGNGVMWLYPLSTDLSSLDLFWPEDLFSYVAAGIAGVVLVVFGWVDRARDRLRWRLSWRRVAIAVCALLVIAATAWATAGRLTADQPSLVGVLPQELERGAPVLLDREVVVAVEPLTVLTGAGDRAVIEGASEDVETGDVISASGTWLDSTVRVERIHVHRERLREALSAIGALMLAAVVAFPWLIRRLRQARSRSAPP